MDRLTELEQKSIYIIREAYAKYRNMALLWSIGKDSTTLLWLVRKAFFGKIPFPVIHIDTSFKMDEIYSFREKYAKEFGLNLIVFRNEEALAAGVNSQTHSRLDCCQKLKTDALKKVIAKNGFQAILLGIRRDEHGIRAKERVFSPRTNSFEWQYKNQPAELWNMYKRKVAGDEHVRVHPLLDWSEVDIWRYIEREKIPVVTAYFAKNGKRYRSIGCAPCCTPMGSSADTVAKIIAELSHTKISERSGRAQDAENSYNMQKLRSLGYM
ncbi:MAG TPA: sulfate adenylyltransferase subunit CysD [Acidobacteriota bacterium]|nr:sulfate adenylyltransferase subunit CysD [Acidobacteriota bacterium]